MPTALKGVMKISEFYLKVELKLRRSILFLEGYFFANSFPQFSLKLLSFSLILTRQILLLTLFEQRLLFLRVVIQ